MAPKKLTKKEFEKVSEDILSGKSPEPNAASVMVKFEEAIARQSHRVAAMTKGNALSRAFPDWEINQSGNLHGNTELRIARPYLCHLAFFRFQDWKAQIQNIDGIKIPTDVIFSDEFFLRSFVFELINYADHSGARFFMGYPFNGGPLTVSRVSAKNPTKPIGKTEAMTRKRKTRAEIEKEKSRLSAGLKKLWGGLEILKEFGMSIEVDRAAEVLRKEADRVEAEYLEYLGPKRAQMYSGTALETVGAKTAQHEALLLDYLLFNIRTLLRGCFGIKYDVAYKAMAPLATSLFSTATPTALEKRCETAEVHKAKKYFSKTYSSVANRVSEDQQPKSLRNLLEFLSDRDF